MQFYVELNEEEKAKLYGDNTDDMVSIFKIPFDDLDIGIAEKMMKFINNRLEKRKKAILNKATLGGVIRPNN